MKLETFAVALLLVAASAAPSLAQFNGSEVAICEPDAWVRCTELYVPRENPTCWTNPTNPWRGSYLACPQVGVTGNLAGLPPNQWSRLSVTQLGIPTDAKAVLLHTLMIITHGTSSEVVGGTVSFRRPGSPYDNSLRYHTQTCEAQIGGGQRANDSIWCPIENGEIEIYWRPQRAVSADWPAGSSIGMNIAVNAWAR